MVILEDQVNVSHGYNLFNFENYMESIQNFLSYSKSEYYRRKLFIYMKKYILDHEINLGCFQLDIYSYFFVSEINKQNQVCFIQKFNSRVFIHYSLYI